MGRHATHRSPNDHSERRKPTPTIQDTRCRVCRRDVVIVRNPTEAQGFNRKGASEAVHVGDERGRRTQRVSAGYFSAMRAKLQKACQQAADASEAAA